uniref:Transmembrane protein n=1 Tax=Rhizophora mucronata TaxID=61149 RepID=A0A2P2NIQ9_RHIMU
MVEVEHDHVFLDSLTIGNDLELLDHSHHSSSIPDTSQTTYYHKSFLKQRQRSMVSIRDASLVGTNSAADDDFHVFPPSSHENLIPSNFDLDPTKYPSPPLASAYYPPPVSDPNPENSPPFSVSPVPRWWFVALQVLRSKIINLGSRFRRYVVGDGRNRTVYHSFWNVAFAAATVVAWWLCVRIKRRWPREEHVGHLLRIIREKDEMIIQLLNQMAQMNEVLLTHHKALAAKLAGSG